MALYGHAPDINPEFDSNIYQGREPLCAVKCQELILRDFGIQIPAQELKEYATEQGWYGDYGTPRSKVCNILQKCGIEMNTSYGNNVESLVRELDQGHRIIVSVDAAELTSEYGSEQWAAFESEDMARHVVIVSGIEIDEECPENSKVIITDPGAGLSYKEYRLDHFVKSWEDSKCYMASSVEAAPYQYNSLTHEMEYTDFANDQIVAEYPFHDEISDIWSINEADYVPEDEYMDISGHDFSVFDQLRHHPAPEVSEHDFSVFDQFRHHPAPEVSGHDFNLDDMSGFD